MNDKPIMRLFEENELNISRLYALYAEKNPSKESFWSGLSREEIEHAAQIRNGEEELGNWEMIEENKFTRGVVRHVMDFVLDEIERAKNGKISHIEALHVALRVERSMLEKKCFDMFIPTDVTIKNLLKKMNRETERHILVLMKEMKKMRQSFPEK